MDIKNQLKHRANLNDLLPDNAIIAEIGTAEGYFASDMLRWPQTRVLYLVDNWGTIQNQTGDGNNPQEWHDKNYSAAMMRVNFAIEKVKVLRGISWDMAAHVKDESLDMVYLDACHSYECVKKDLQAWVPKVKKGGIVAGHDMLNRAYGVYEAVKEFTGGNFIIIPENKSEDAGFWFTKK